MEKIEVTISIDEYPKGWTLNPALYESYIVGRLKEAGISIEGHLTFRGLRKGELFRIDDPCSWDKVKYVWKDGDEI